MSPAIGARGRKQSGQCLGPPDANSTPRPSPTANEGRWGTGEQLTQRRSQSPQLGEQDRARTCSGHDQEAARVREGEGSLKQQPPRVCPEAESVLGRSTGSPAVSSTTKPSPPRQAPGPQTVPARLQGQAEAFLGPSANVTLLCVACRPPPGQKQGGFPAPLVTSETGEVWAERPASPGCTEGTLGLTGTKTAHCRLAGCAGISHARVSRDHRQRGCPAASEVSQQRDCMAINHSRTEEGLGLAG